MRKKIAFLLVLALMLFLCACSKNNSHLHDKVEQVETKGTEVSNSEKDDIRSKLLGTWINGYWGRIVSFVDNEKCVLIEGTGNEFEMMSVNYELIDADTMVISSPAGEAATMTITLSGNELDLEEEGYEGFFENDIFTRASEENRCSVVGNWELFGIDEEYSAIINSRVTPINNLIFYSDGTYTMESEFPRNGNYALVHDGASICLDGKIYWDIDFPCAEVMLVTLENGNTLLYVIQ